jgi:hypothetical protein
VCEAFDITGKGRISREQFLDAVVAEGVGAGGTDATFLRHLHAGGRPAWWDVPGQMGRMG